VKNPLKNLKIAPYYGCMLLRPKEVGIDDPEDPTIQAELLSTLGTEVIDNPYKKVCCGSYQTVQDKYVVSDLAYDILTRAQGEGAAAITTSCPLCAFNLDNRQKEVKERHPDFKEIPVFYFTQLMAIAFGLDEKYYRFDLNYIDPQPLLKKKNLL
jgi:heterodisulfide reductase subunit B